MSSSYTRRRAPIVVSSDRPVLFKRALRSSSDRFATDRRLVWNRQRDYLPAVANALANAYKLGLAPFPSHFEYDGVAFTLEEPAALAAASKTDRKNASWHAGVLAALAADGSRDRLAVLCIGLATAGKIPHWVEYDDYADLSDAAFSESELDED
jgi:hypothetical protein